LIFIIGKIRFQVFEIVLRFQRHAVPLRNKATPPYSPTHGDDKGRIRDITVRILLPLF
jgi:hypothetical protein